MKGTNIGEFEELVLLTIASQIDQAYSVLICDEIERVTGRKVKLGVVHSVLNRLEEKELINSKLGEATKVRGGRRKRFFEVSQTGKAAIIKAKEQRDKLWGNIPEVVFDGII